MLIGYNYARGLINIKDLNKVNWKAITAGTGISTIASIIIGSPILLLTGGYAAAYIASGSYKNGIKYGFFTSGVSAVISLIILSGLGRIPEKIVISSVTELFAFLFASFLVGGIFGSIGGLVGIFSKKRRNRYTFKRN